MEDGRVHHVSNCVMVKPCGVHGAKSINVTNARYNQDAVSKEASKLRCEHLWDAVRFMGLLIGSLPDHKRIFDVYKATHLLAGKSYSFFFLFFYGISSKNKYPDYVRTCIS